MSSKIILYDLPSRTPSKCWSLNPWKARASLNYKGLAYKTEWLEYPDLAPTFIALGIPKNDGITSLADYSSPAVKMSDGSYIMDSRKIAEALDKIQPEPSLHMDQKEIIDRTQAAVAGTHQSLAPVCMPRIPELLLNPKSAEYFNETRAKRYGMSLQELAKSDKAGETAWKNAEPYMTDLKKLLTENPDGKYVLGKEICFADFIVAGLFAFWKTLDKGDLYDRAVQFDPSFLQHVKATQRWFERDD